MAIGDDAVAAGMPICAGTVLANTIDTEITLTRDFIAQRTAAVTPIAKGGTGATTAAAARTALGIPAWDYNVTPNTIVSRAPDGYLSVSDGVQPVHPASMNQLGGKRDLTDGGFGSTPIYTPHGRANPVTTSYVAAYLNSDGRLGATPSALRFKKDVQDYDYTVAQLRAIRVVSYRLRAALYGSADAPLEVGVIAEELIAAGLGEFVAHDEDGSPFTVHYERLALVAISAVQHLADDYEALADDYEALAERVTALEQRP